MEQKAKDEKPYVQKLQKGTTLASWADLMRIFLSKVPSARGIATMVYVTRKEAQVPIVDPELATDQTHSIKHGLVEYEYGNRLLHSDVRFWNDNGTLFGYLQEETRGTTFLSSIRTYERTCNGRVAWMHLNKKHGGEKKRREQLKTALAYISGTKWNGSTNITLERYIRNCLQA